MAYDHYRKAGNPGDVWKHFILLSVVEALVEEGATPGRVFRYMETHCGAPRHRLGENGEWRNGVGAVLPPIASLGNHPYLQVLSKDVGVGKDYPGSWALVAQHLRTLAIPYKLNLYDTSNAVATSIAQDYSSAFADDMEFLQSDGFSAVEASDQQNLVLIDPPYTPDADADWRACHAAARSLNGRNIPYLIWYPVFFPTKPQELVDAAGWPGFEVSWAHIGSKPSQNMMGCGVIAAFTCAKILASITGALEAIAGALRGRFEIRRSCHASNEALQSTRPQERG